MRSEPEPSIQLAGPCSNIQRFHAGNLWRGCSLLAIPGFGLGMDPQSLQVCQLTAQSHRSFLRPRLKGSEQTRGQRSPIERILVPATYEAVRTNEAVRAVRTFQAGTRMRHPRARTRYITRPPLHLPGCSYQSYSQRDRHTRHHPSLDYRNSTRS
jgi:hypothetical protein